MKSKERIINADGSIQGETFSGEKYKGEYPSPKYGKETYEQFYRRVEELSKQGFHKGDLSWGDWRTYLYGCPGGGGQYVQHCIIGNVRDDEWVKHDVEEKSNDDEYLPDEYYENED
jgi:hypothetical protein